MSKSEKTTPIFIRRAQLKTITGLSPSTVDRLEAEGQFPKRRRIGPGCVGWLFAEVREALEQASVVKNG